MILALAAIPGLQASVRERTNEKEPVWDRRNSNAAATRMIAAKPLVGFGWGRFANDSADYYRQAATYPLTSVRNVHNVYLANAVELGLLGALLWLQAINYCFKSDALLWLVACVVAVGGAVMRRGPPELRPWKIGLIAVAVSYAVVGLTTPLGYVLPALLMWTWAGIARGAAQTAAPAR